MTGAFAPLHARLSTPATALHAPPQPGGPVCRALYQRQYLGANAKYVLNARGGLGAWIGAAGPVTAQVLADRYRLAAGRAGGWEPAGRLATPQ
jgi:hypothetical protein